MHATEITDHESGSCRTGSDSAAATLPVKPAQVRSPILQIVHDYNERYAFAMARRGVVLLSVLAAIFVPWGYASAVFVAVALMTACSLYTFRRPINLCSDEFVPDDFLGILAASVALDDDTRDALRSAADAAGGLASRVLLEQVFRWERAHQERECREAPGFRALMGHGQSSRGEGLEAAQSRSSCQQKASDHEHVVGQHKCG